MCFLVFLSLLYIASSGLICNLKVFRLIKHNVLSSVSEQRTLHTVQYHVQNIQWTVMLNVPQHNTDLLLSPAVWCLCQLLYQYSSELITALLNPSVRKISSHDQSSHVYNIYSNVLLQYHDIVMWIITMTSALPACNSLLLVIYQKFHIQSLLRATCVIVPLKQSRV